MKIGLLTMPLHTNYGGILQAYALKTILERMDNQVIVITEKYHRERLPLYHVITYLKRIIKKYILLRSNVHIFQEDYDNKIYPILSKNTQLFINKYFEYIDKSEISSKNSFGFDALVVGSDQVWRPFYYPKIEDAFLKFAEYWDVIRLSYAASFGANKWEYSEEQTIICSKLIQRFDAVSVREDSGVILCEEYLSSTAVHVLDPTLLLDKEDYIKLINNTITDPVIGNLLTYILDENETSREIVEYVSNIKKMVPFMANSKFENPKAPWQERIQPSIEQWLKGFNEASFVIADSFHACIFSIIFHRNFIVISNKTRGIDRLRSLLKLFNLEDRIIFEKKDVDKVINNNIDFEITDNKLQKMRDFSLKYLSVLK